MRPWGFFGPCIYFFLLVFSLYVVCSFVLAFFRSFFLSFFLSLFLSFFLFCLSFCLYLFLSFFILPSGVFCFCFCLFGYLFACLLACVRACLLGLLAYFAPRYYCPKCPMAPEVVHRVMACFFCVTGSPLRPFGLPLTFWTF